MADISRIAYIALLLFFIASIPLTWLSKYAWKSRKLFLLFAALGLFSFLALMAIVWSDL